MASHDGRGETLRPIWPTPIGYWVDDDRPDLPAPADVVDPSWELAERQQVAGYLSGGRPIEPGCGCSPCRICGQMNGFVDLTDGIYIWPEGLAHYVLDHAVRLPDAVVHHTLDPPSTATPVGPAQDQAGRWD